MQKTVILTLTGPDRIGIVDEVTGLLLARGGNVETSRMARLGGEFAILMLVTIPTERFSGINGDFQDLSARGYTVSIADSSPTPTDAQPTWAPFRIELHGADHEGIIHEVAHYLSQSGINIESMASDTFAGAITGVPLITVTAAVAVPPTLAETTWRAGLEKIGAQLNLEIRVSSTKES
jgi:glycine cleavage system transcriptional repressor